MAKESTYPTASLASGDYLRIVADPGGTPATKNVISSPALVNLNAGNGFHAVTQSGTPPTYTIVASDFGKTIITNQSITNYITIPDGLPGNFFFRVLQLGTGSTVIQGNGTSAVTGISSSGDVLVATGAPNAIADVIPYTTDTYVVSGSNLTIPPFANSFSMYYPSYTSSDNLQGSFDYNGISQLTYLAWIKGSVSAGSGHDLAFMGSTNNHNYIKHDTGTLALNGRINGTNISAPGTIAANTNTWLLYGVTFNSGTWEHFINGVSSGSATTGPTSFNSLSTTTWRFGTIGTGGAFGDYLDMVGIYNDVLTAAEQLELYNGGTPINFAVDVGNYTSSANLMHLFNMGDNDGGLSATTITDMIGSSDLTINGNCAVAAVVP